VTSHRPAPRRLIDRRLRFDHAAVAGANDRPRPRAARRRLRRCSDGDPDRFAWFCIVGRVLYGAAAFLQPDGLSLSVK